MTLDEEIKFWGERQDKASTKELALVCFGIKWGLEIARADHGATNDRKTLHDEAKQGAAL